MLIVSTGVGACSAHKQKPASPATAAVVEIPSATPAQLESFDSDKNAVPAGRVHVATTAAPPRKQRYVDVDDPFRSSRQPQQPRGGPDCVAAALCCEKLMQQSRGGPSGLKMCDAIRRQPDSMCRQFLVAVRHAVANKGLSCP